MKSKIKFTFSFYLVLIISIMVGRFKIFTIITLFTIFHELGHIIFSIFFNWKIEKILILPLGCLTVYNNKVNTSLKEDVIVTIAGPFFQALLFLLINNSIYFKYNLIILLFNLLPIYPLDGYKLLKSFLYNLLSFKKTNNIILYISVIVLCFLLIRDTSLLVYIIFVVFFIQIIKEYKNNHYIYNKFVYERYLYDIKYKKKAIIKGNDISKMYKYKNHLFWLKNKLKEEHEILFEMFDKP